MIFFKYRGWRLDSAEHECPAFCLLHKSDHTHAHIKQKDHSHASTGMTSIYSNNRRHTNTRVIRQVLNGVVHIHAVVLVHWYTNWQVSPLEATITLAFLPVRHMSWGQRTGVIDWVCLIVAPSLFTRVLIYDMRREGRRSFGRWRAGNRAINHWALWAPHFLITSQPIELTVSLLGNRACTGKTF